MIFYKNKTTTYPKNILISLIATCFIGCGGGGGEEENVSTSIAVEAPAVTNIAIEIVEPVIELKEETIVDYSPNPELLLITASTSTELYAETLFDFDSFKSVTFDISAIDNLNQPLSNIMLSISIIDTDITEFDDPKLQDKSLLTKQLTDAYGQVNITLEIAQSVSNVLLELNTLGVENDVILTLDETGRVMHRFQQN